MTRYLARKCPRCSNVVKITQIDGVITDVQGGRQWMIGCTRLKGKPFHYYEGTESQKMIYCSALTREHLSGWSSCSTGMQVSKFEEMKL